MHSLLTKPTFKKLSISNIAEVFIELFEPARALGISFIISPKDGLSFGTSDTETTLNSSYLMNSTSLSLTIEYPC